MRTFEDPIQFDVQKKIGDMEIVYSDLTEFVLGGPQVGMISINGKTLDSNFLEDHACMIKDIVMHRY